MRKKLVIVLLMFVTVLAVFGAVAYWLVKGPNTRLYAGERGVKIPPGSSFGAVVDSLHAARILQSGSTFRLVGRVSGWRDQIKAGYYTFTSGASNYDLLDKLRRGLQTPIKLTIPPGTRPEVVAAVAGRDMAFDAGAFADALRDTTLAASLDTDTTWLFGYMLPETYYVYWLTSPEETIRRIKHEFDAFYDREVAAGAARYHLTKDDVIALAGIIEWETGIEGEKPRVAGVYLNRLRIGMKLDADPTIQYVVQQREGHKRRLLFQDYDVQDPYNTYLHRGLPPGPITNPSPSSLRAVANAEDHEYLYFVANGEGGHTFSRSLSEHNRAAARYRRLMRQRRAQQRANADGSR